MIQTNNDATLVDHALKRLYGQKTGIVRWVSCSASDRKSPDVQITVPSHAKLGVVLGEDANLTIEASGKANDLDAAISGGIGEMVERYCLSGVSEDDLAWSTYEELNSRENTVNPAYYNIYDAPIDGEWLSEWDRETECAWCAGTNLLTGEDTYVPAELVWMRVGPLASEPIYFPGTSSGCAAGPSLEFALREAIYEAIERDAFLRSWCTGRPPTQLSLDGYPDVRRMKARRIDGDTYSSRLFEFESDVDIPVIGAAMTNHRDETPKFVMGASAQVDRKSAYIDALGEISQGWIYIEQLAVQKDIDDIDPLRIVDNFEDNLLYYLHPDHFEDVSFLLEGDPQPVGEDENRVESVAATSELQYCFDELSENGYTPIAFEVTTREMLEVGLRVVRVFIPEMVPLTPPSVLPVHHPGFEDPITNTKPHPFP